MMIKRKKMASVISITVILLIGFFGGLYLLGVRSEPYRFALQYIDANKTIIQSLGELRSRRLAFFGYSVRYDGPEGHAKYKIRVSGEDKKGNVYLDLRKSAGKWQVTKGNLVLDTGETIPLDS